MASRPRSKRHKGLEPNLYFNGVSFSYRNPVTGKRHGMGSDKVKAQAAARILNARLMKGDDLVARVEGRAGITLSAAAESFFKERVEQNPKLKESSRLNKHYVINRLIKDRGDTELSQIDTRWCASYLDESFLANAYVQHRSVLSQIFEFARTKGWVDANPVTPTAKSDVSYKKNRQRLTRGQYRAIHELAEPWFRIALELALICCMGRAEVTAMRYDHIVDGRLRYVRQKTAGRSATANVAIQMTPAIEDVIARSREVSPLSPYVVHRVPYRVTAQIRRSRDHWAMVSGNMISREFARLRDQLPEIKRLKPEERPTFHEVRSLGSHLLEDAGVPEADIQVLMGHADVEMTRHYLDGHGTRWHEAKGATLDLNALLGE
ncbi:tyrosine-type recombinase/integrase [Kushneria aurantia]|uniref:Tyrosine-type recombinase/integrase n=1 Tax=Kushneria aurantia TaxID=504092 RepID=A0ABV6G4E9_9GAMM|nr:tyrosine-type recombinase/integrase [Kushneria aurantia]